MPYFSARTFNSSSPKANILSVPVCAALSEIKVSIAFPASFFSNNSFKPKE
jgi:hypothetical protein